MSAITNIARRERIPLRAYGRGSAELDRIERQLRQDLEGAQEQLKAKRDILQRVRDLPNDLPDAVIAIHNASRAHHAALAAFRLALRRFSRFVIDGTLPDDLKKS